MKVNKNFIYYTVPLYLILIFIVQTFYFANNLDNITYKFILYLTYYIYFMILLNYYICSNCKNKTFIRKYDSNFLNNKIICTKCDNKLKPDRTHHCSICKTCNLKMDHHCPFMNNCITIKNHKLFVTFLFYCILLLIVFSYCYIHKFLNEIEIILNYSKVEKIVYKLIFYIITLFIIIGCYIPSTSLFWYHFKLSLINSTTLEEMKDNNNIYNFGYYYNFRKFYGNFLNLLLPLYYTSNIYEGYYFPRKDYNKYKIFSKDNEINNDEILDFNMVLLEKLPNYDKVKFILN